MSNNTEQYFLDENSADDIDRLREFLQKFLIKFAEEENMICKSEKLHHFASSFLKKNSDQGIYFEFISKAISQIPSLFDAIINSIDNKIITQKSLDEIENRLQASGLCLETLCLSLRTSINPEEMLLLYDIILKTLYSAYKHCKDSEFIYGDLLESVADKLAVFFKSIQDLETVLLIELEKLCLSKSLSLLESISSHLGKIGQLLSQIDNMMAFKFWKVYIRFIVRHQNFLKNHSDIDAVLEFLASEIISTLRNVQCESDESSCEEKDFNLKVCSMQLNVIIKILEQFHECIFQSVHQLTKMVLTLHSLLILSYSQKLKDTSNLKLWKSILLKTTYPLISLLMKNVSFCDHVFSWRVKGDDSCHFVLATFFLKIALLYPSEGVKFREKESLLSCFETLQDDKLEGDAMLVTVLIPQSALATHTQLKEGCVSLYDHACIQLCAYIKTLSDSFIEDAVESLLKILISSSCIVSLLLSDVLVYRLRCSSVQFLYSFCLQANQICENMKPNMNIFNLFKRLLKFLPHHKKLELLQESKIFRNVNLKLYPESHRYVIPQIETSEESASNNIHHQIDLLMEELNGEFASSIEKLSHKACCCLVLISHFVDIVPSAELFKFIQFANHMFKSEVFDVQVTVLTVLKAFNKRYIPDTDPYCNYIIESLASLFVATLQSQNYLVRCEALRTFADFAQTTPHPKVFQEVAKLDPSLVPLIKVNFTLVPVAGYLPKEVRLKALLRHCSTFRKQPYRQIEESSKKILELLAVKK